MSLAATLPERLARARADMRSGLPCCCSTAPTASPSRPPPKTLDAARLTAMAALGAPVLAITRWRAETLKGHGL